MALCKEPPLFFCWNVATPYVGNWSWHLCIRLPKICPPIHSSCIRNIYNQILQSISINIHNRSICKSINIYLTLNTLKINLILHARCFACMPQICLVPEEIGWHRIPMTWICRWLWYCDRTCGYWEQKPGTREEPVLLTAELFLQALTFTFQLHKKITEWKRVINILFELIIHIHPFNRKAGI